MNNFYTSCLLIFVLAMSALCLSGCSNNVKAGGKVFLEDGTPLDRGMVKFENEKYQYTGLLNSDGTFKLGGLAPGDGLPEGTYKVSLMYVRGDNDAPMLEPKYETGETSGIVVEIKKGNTDPIEIKVAKSKVKRKSA